MRAHVANLLAGEIDDLPAQRGRELHIDLLPDNRPAESVEARWDRRHAQASAAPEQRRQLLILRHARLERRHFVIQPKHS